MADITLTIEASEVEGLEQDIADFKTKLGAAIQTAMNTAGEDARAALREAIMREVYDSGHPNTYLRRSEHSGFGPSLTQQADGAYYNPQPGGLVFIYSPSGANSATTADLDPSHTMYDADNPKSLNPSPLDGDALIRRIETGKWYATKYSEERPFWQKFVEDMIEGGTFERSLVNGTRGTGFDVKLDGNHVQREPQDGSY